MSDENKKAIEKALKAKMKKYDAIIDDFENGVIEDIRANQLITILNAQLPELVFDLVEFESDDEESSSEEESEEYDDDADE